MGQTAFSLIRSRILRVAVVLMFAIPAAVAGYSTTLALFGLTGASEGWRLAFAFLGDRCRGDRLAAACPDAAID